MLSTNINQPPVLWRFLYLKFCTRIYWLHIKHLNGSFVFPFKILNFSFQVCEKCIIRDCTESTDHLGQYGHFNNTVSSNLRTWCIFLPVWVIFSFFHHGLILFEYRSFAFVKWSEVKVTRSCSTLCDPTDYMVHGVLKATTLEWVTVPFSRGSPQPRDGTQVSSIAGGFFTSWATREAQGS